MTVGSELKSLTADPTHNDAWRAVIEAVATDFPGQLGYAANWDEYANANVASILWDNPHIDFLGVDLYPDAGHRGSGQCLRGVSRPGVYRDRRGRMG